MTIETCLKIGDFDLNDKEPIKFYDFELQFGHLVLQQGRLEYFFLNKTKKKIKINF